METESHSFRIPLTVKVVYTLFLLVLIPVYWAHYGLSHFLWLSDIVLLLAYAAVMLESRLLASIPAVGGLVLESIWIIDFVLRLVVGLPFDGVTDYMFDEDLPLYLRALSLFHAAMPPLLLWLIWRLGYDPRAWKIQSLIMVMVVPLTFLLTDPEDNINWVFGYQAVDFLPLPPAVYLLGHLFILVFVIFWPTHYVLKKLHRRWHGSG